MGKRYATMPRMPYETDWGISTHYLAEERHIVEESVAAVAEKAGLVLFSRTPEAGWESNYHSRDGKHTVCAEHTQSARTVWVWAAR